MKKEKLKFWNKLGPGLITGASDDDPSGIATYMQAGAKFGLSMLWPAVLTYPLMYGVQEMCARIGIVTGQGLTKIIKSYYPKILLYLLFFLMIPAVILNIAADLSAMGTVSNLLLPMIPSSFFSFIFTLIILVVVIRCNYKKCASILKWLCLSLGVYMIVPFFIRQDALEILRNTFIPSIKWDYDFAMILVAILGTTISPYLFFWQSSMSAEDMNHKEACSLPKQISEMKYDVNIGMFVSNLIMYFIILTAATVLYPKGITNINTVEEAAQALVPLAGNLAGLLFSVGIIGTGLLTIPVLASCMSYMSGELFDWSIGLDKKPHQAIGFYTIMVVSLALAFLLNLLGLNPIKSLIYTAVLYGLIAPVLILIILLVANNQKIMGKNRNKWGANFLGTLGFLLMSGACILMIYQVFQ
jgi:NRAMP (natural resistance-associated macrophage protein)-like metal ion transporter